MKPFAIASMIVLGLAACGGSGTEVSAEFHLMGIDNAFIEGDECEGASGYDDIGEGTPARVTDEEGTVLASATLDRGRVKDSSGGAVFDCIFDLTFQDVPTDRDFYNIEIARRGEITYSRSEMEETDWTFQLTIGD